ncbi:MAG: hypothetical protein ACI4XB_07640 [Ruminococcus sp.]
MAKTPKKDINLYTLVAAPKTKTVKKGALFAVLGIVAVVLLGGSYTGVKIYVHTQEQIAEELQEKANDAELMEKIANANAVAADISTLRTAGNAYSEVRKEIEQSRAYCDDFSDDLIEKLLECETFHTAQADVTVATITGLSFDGSTLSISASSSDSKYVSYFVTNLTRLGIFSDISYTGYSLSGEEYTYTVSAVFVAHVYEETTEPATEVVQ